jgi:hypothetical protein
MSYCITVHPLVVAINKSAALNAVTPQFPVMVIVAETTTAKLLKISTIASRESWQLANETVLWNTIWQRLSELAPFAKVVKSVVIAAVESAGIELSDKQLRNIALIFVTLAVLNKGTDLRDWQVLNILLIFVTFAVSKSGTD